MSPACPEVARDRSDPVRHAARCAGPGRDRRGPRVQRPARLHRRRPARRRLPRGAVTASGRPAVAAAFLGRLRGSPSTWPRPASQGRRRPRPGHRHRGAGGGRGARPPRRSQDHGVPRRARPRRVSAAVAGVVPMVATPMVAGTVVVPMRAPRRPPLSAGTRCARARDPGRAGRARLGRCALARSSRVRGQRGSGAGRTRARPGRRAGPAGRPRAPSRWRRPAVTTSCSTGPPGAGKTMLARRLPGLLPRLERRRRRWRRRASTRPPGSRCLPAAWWSGRRSGRPTTAPRPSRSSAAGSACMRPGEISLAHGGVLFLDELGEFPAAVLDCLRQPLEEGVVRHHRGHGASVDAAGPVPARRRHQPVPVRRRLRPDGTCRCGPTAAARYRRRLSGAVARPLRPAGHRVPARRRRPGVGPARRAVERGGGAGGRRRGSWPASGASRCNAELPASRLEEVAPLTPAARTLLECELRSGTLTARGLHRVRRVARTLADLAGADTVVGEEHVCLALGLRGEVLGEDGAA